MPPRYAYWTILVDDQPTAFRAGALEDLMPTFKRLQSKHPSAKMMWFQNGKLWDSRIDAQEAMRARGDIGRARDPRQVGFRSRDRAPFKPQAPSHRPTERRSPRPPSGERPEWKPKGSGPDRSEKPEWKPKGTFNDRGAPSTRERFRDSKPSARSGQGKLEWRPKGGGTSGSPLPDPGSREKRKWVPKAEYKRSQAPGPKTQAPRDKNWRPGGEHKDPRQKYKDAKKAKWTRFKQTIRKRSEGKPGKKKAD